LAARFLLIRDYKISLSMLNLQRGFYRFAGWEFVYFY
jgi:hypothetical protein